MQLHSEFRALTRSKEGLARMLNLPNPKDGAYARVVPQDHATVLKATSCPATNLLFSELLKLAKSGPGTPQALPAVFKDHGLCMEDHDGVRYHVWEVERLFEPDDLDAMQLARVLGRARLTRAKPSNRTRTLRGADSLLEPLRNAVAQEQSRVPPQPTWDEHAQVAAALAVRTEGALHDAFVFLETFVREHRIELDLLTRGNILVDMFGQPVFSDPVCPAYGSESTRVPDVDLEATSAERECLVVEVPMELLPGLQVALRYRSTFAAPAAVLDQVAQECNELSLAYLRTGIADPQRLALERAPPRFVSVWSVPDVARRLREDRYVRLLQLQ